MISRQYLSPSSSHQGNMYSPFTDQCLPIGISISKLGISATSNSRLVFRANNGCVAGCPEPEAGRNLSGISMLAGSGYSTFRKRFGTVSWRQRYPGYAGRRTVFSQAICRMAERRLRNIRARICGWMEALSSSFRAFLRWMPVLLLSMMYSICPRWGRWRFSSTRRRSPCQFSPCGQVCMRQVSICGNLRIR